MMSAVLHMPRNAQEPRLRVAIARLSTTTRGWVVQIEGEVAPDRVAGCEHACRAGVLDGAVHLTEKPADLTRRAIEYPSKAGQNVLDLFGGSGWTLIAAEEMGRRAFLMELDPLYGDVIVQRWEGFTGTKAQRLGAAAAV
jgi:DNA modification methylase